MLTSWAGTRPKGRIQKGDEFSIGIGIFGLRYTERK